MHRRLDADVEPETLRETSADALEPSAFAGDSGHATGMSDLRPRLRVEASRHGCGTRAIGARVCTDDGHRCELPSDAAVAVGGHPA